MKMADGGFRPAYNPQFATDLDGLVIVGADVINAGSDGGQMDPMLEQIEEHQGQLPGEYYTDGGFSTKDDIEKVGQRGVTVFTPVKEEEKRLKAGKDPFAPQKGDKPKVAEWRQRMGTPEAKVKYKQRTKCEWTNAMCRQRNLWQFTVRGLAKVKAVVWWYVLAHDLLRGVALMRRPSLTSDGSTEGGFRREINHSGRNRDPDTQLHDACKSRTLIPNGSLRRWHFRKMPPSARTSLPTHQFFHRLSA